MLTINNSVIAMMPEMDAGTRRRIHKTLRAVQLAQQACIKPESEPEQARMLSELQLIEHISGFGIRVDREQLRELCQNELRSDEVIHSLYYNVELSDEQEERFNWLWVCLRELCVRWFPDAMPAENAAVRIIEGYDVWTIDLQKTFINWMAAWPCLVKTVEQTDVRSADRLSEILEHCFDVVDWILDFAEVMGEVAGRKDFDLHKRRVEFCEDMLKIIKFGKEQKLAQSYLGAAITESRTILADPDQYDLVVDKVGRGARQQAFAVREMFTSFLMRDARDELLEELNTRPSKKKSRRKVGANEQCPCNTGKNYKRCCGKGKTVYRA